MSESFHLDQVRLGQILHEARLSLGISLREAGKMCGLSHTHILKIENGEIEVSLRNFVRLSLTLGFPAGLLIEWATLISRNAFHPLNDERVKMMALEVGGNVARVQAQIADFAAGSALIVAYLVRASNPLVMVESFTYPVPGQKEVFRKLAQIIETTFSPVDRRDIITMLIADTIRELSTLQLFTKEFLSAYLALCRQKNPAVLLPWIPFPSPSFIDVPGIVSTNPYEIEVRLLHLGQQEEDSKRGPRKTISKEPLDKLPAKVDATAVQNEIRNLKDLVAYLKKVTASRGAKAALARELGVTRQAVNQWLSGESAPSADIAIRLQHWKPKPAK